MKGDQLDFHPTNEVKETTWTAKYDTKDVIGYCFPTGELPKEFKDGWAKAKAAFL